MLTEIKTPADLAKLPFYVKAAMSFGKVNVSGMRREANINKASRKALLHEAVARAIREGEISLGLGVEMLFVNKAYGPKGKKALKEFA